MGGQLSLEYAINLFTNSMEKSFIKILRILLMTVWLLLLVTLILLVVSIVFYSGEVSIGLGEFTIEMNENYYSGLITIIASIVAIALPLSISVITQQKDDIFNSNEMADSFYEEPTYKRIKLAVLLLILLSIFSYFKSLSIFLIVPSSA
ncbi:MAG: hypothetical protein RIE55_00880, partial [Marinoscillum sp.]